jgi:hypothetical protein
VVVLPREREREREPQRAHGCSTCSLLAAWALGIVGKGLYLRVTRRNAAVDKTGLEDCPICLEEPADVQMNPCKHTCCGGCLDQWMSQKSSFASTLRAGSSDTTCPMCRQVVSETAAARPTAESAASALASRVEEEDDADLDVDWIALANQRQAEVMAQARVLREELTAPLPTLPPPQARRAPQAPIGTPQAPIGSQRAPIGTPNRHREESAC